MRRVLALAIVWTCGIVMGAYAQSAGSSHAEGNRVFAIGTFDRSSHEFAAGSAPGAINFVVGKSDPSKDWYAIQLASALKSEGSQDSGAAQQRQIKFTLDGAPVSQYQMHIAVLTGYSLEPTGVPILVITVNGKHGKFFLHPQLDYSNGDFGDFYNPSYSHADVSFSFPGTYLHQGLNEINIDVVQASNQSIQNAGITYDAIELVAQKDNSGIQPRIDPTIFYLSAPLREIVDVFVRYPGPVRSGSPATLRIEGNDYRQTVQEGQDFGEVKFEFAVPDFEKSAAVRLDWEADGRAHHLDTSIAPNKKWTLLLVPHIHLDVGYSDYQAKVASLQSRVFDQAMDMTAEHPEYRFSTDGEWNLEQFLKTRSEADQQRIISAIQKRQIFIPAVYAQLHTGTPTAETLIRSLYPSANFSREHGTPFNYANSTDVPSYSWSYASILKSAGIDYFLAGSDNIRAPVLLQGRLNENSPFWWPGPDGKKVLLWYSRHYMQMQLLFGLPPSLAAGHESLPSFMQQYERSSYRPNAVILFGTQQENRALFPEQAELAERWNKSYAYPRLEYSGVYDAMKTIEQQFGSDIPTVCCDGGPYWEEGTGTDAYYAAMERANESRGPSAEKLATLTSIVNPRLAPDKKDLDQMWTDMVLMDEHTWASDHSETDPLSEESVQQTAVKEQFGVNARAIADFIARNSMASITDSISADAGSVVVFNTLNWKRSAPVFLDLAHDQTIIDSSTGKPVATEIISKSNNLDRVRFVANDVPAVGYKVFATQTIPASPNGPEEKIDSQLSKVIESPFYRVVLSVSSGAITSVYDKELKRELVNQESAYKFGQYLYVSGGDDPPGTILNPASTILDPSSVGPKPKLEIHPAHDGRLIAVKRTPEGWVARLVSSSMNTPKVETEIRLFDQEKKIEITEDVEKERVFRKEGAYFAFPLAMIQPRFQYEIQTGVVDPAKDSYPGAGHEWFPIQHWIAAQQDGLSVAIMPLDSSLVTIGDINRGAWPNEFGKRSGTIFSYALNNYWFTNFPAGQGGHFQFRYVISSSQTTNAPDLTRRGWEEMTPLERNQLLYQDRSSNAKRPLSGKAESFVTTEDPDLLLGTWKEAEDGNGTILRFYDFGGTTRTASVRIPLLDIQEAFQTDAVERDQTRLALTDAHTIQFVVHPHEIITVRLRGSDAIEAIR